MKLEKLYRFNKKKRKYYIILYLMGNRSSGTDQNRTGGNDRENEVQHID